MTTETIVQKRRGPKLIDVDQKRGHCVSVRMNLGELAQLDKDRGVVQRGEWLRKSWSKDLPSTIPQINRDAYSELSRVASNLNQIVRHLNSDQAMEVAALSLLLAELRRSMIGVV